ncbi:MAG: hypothetical protein AABY64_08530 [Bdellovibrionota bacterium]
MQNKLILAILSHHRRFIKNFGEDMLTWIIEGSMIGLLVGLIVGLAFYVMIGFGYIFIKELEYFRSQSPIFFFCLFFLSSALFGAAAGALVGIGVPKFNPHPQQGLRQNKRNQT